jgi:Putative bacterial sensory transduction regulator
MRVFSGCILAFMALASAAAAQNITAENPDSIVGALHEYGVAASLETDDSGMPVIYMRIAGVNSSVLFYGCDKDGKKCDSIAFDSWFKVNAGYTPNQANDWNQKNRYAGSYVDTSGAAHLSMDVNLSGGGLGPETFANIIDWWDVSLTDYKDHIGW